jgi:DNA modification methylase
VIHHGDCLDVMATMDPESIDAIVTDPPYGIGFMGKEWDGFSPSALAAKMADYQHIDHKKQPARSASQHAGNSYDRSLEGNRRFGEWCEGWGRAAYRVAKPSAYLLAFGGTRTVHRMTVALEDAGWIIRDMLVWGYASGFPKSKASLKPAWEPIVMARKPGPLRMLAIDECRIPSELEDGRELTFRSLAPGATVNKTGDWKKDEYVTKEYPSGRWPANIVLTDPIFDGGIEGVVGGGEASYNPPGVFGQQRGDQPTDSAAAFAVRRDGDGIFGYGDTGTYSRFFLVPKSSRSDREPVLGGLPETDDPFAGTAHSYWCETCGKQRVNVPGSACECAEPKWTNRAQRKRANNHPTVKPVDLMRHLVRLVTPAGGTVPDPFLGSGTTGLAAEMEGFAWVGIEREAEYVAIAEARLNGTQRGLGLETA